MLETWMLLAVAAVLGVLCLLILMPVKTDRDQPSIRKKRPRSPPERGQSRTRVTHRSGTRDSTLRM
jgi:hypothetical protein